jgi:hypothetical protein
MQKGNFRQCETIQFESRIVKTTIKLITLYLIVFWPLLIYADYRDAEALKMLCFQYEKFRSKGLSDPLTIEQLKMILDAGRCDGYVASTIDFLSVSKDVEDKIENGICTPPVISTWHIIREFILYSANNPDELNNSANSVIQKSLFEAFACNKQNSAVKGLPKLTDSYRNARELQNECVKLAKMSSDNRQLSSMSKHEILNFIDAGRCEGYISGTADFMAHSRVSKNNSKPAICVEPFTSISQVLKKVLKHIDSQKEELDNSASLIVQKALFQSFPCK